MRKTFFSLMLTWLLVTACTPTAEPAAIIVIQETPTELVAGEATVAKTPQVSAATAVPSPLPPTAPPTATPPAAPDDIEAATEPATVPPASATATETATAAAEESEADGVVYGRTAEGAFFHGAVAAPITMIDYSDFL